MYSLVIIDDEPLILNGITKIIDWKSFGFTKINTFSNPVKAFEFITHNPPDVILTDIRMPVMTGIDILRKCREVGLSPLTVMVSAYSDFEYARQAIDHGAFTYVLKPLNKEDMTKLAERLVKTLETKGEDVRSVVLKVLTTGITSGISLPKEFEKNTDNSFFCFSSSMDSNVGEWFKIYDDLFFGLVSDLSLLSLSSPIGVSIPNGESLFLRIREALTSYYTLHFYSCSAGILEYKPLHSDFPDCFEELITEISLKNYRKAKILLEELKTVSSEKRILLDSITYIYNRILVAFCSNNEDLPVSPFSDYLSLFEVFRNVDMLTESLMVIADDVLLNDEKNSQVSSQAVKSAVNYIDENYTNQITLEMLSDMFNISLSYLCRQLKNLTGKNFSDYLSDRRISYACKLLKTTDKTVGDIGMISGYEDNFYFSKIFKKKMGVSPSRFREEFSGK